MTPGASASGAQTLEDQAMASKTKSRIMWAGHKTHAQIRQQCIEQGLRLDDSSFRRGVSQFILVQGGGCSVHFSTFTGSFFGVTPDKRHFNVVNGIHDSEPWMIALKEFFWARHGQPAARRPPDWCIKEGPLQLQARSGRTRIRRPGL